MSMLRTAMIALALVLSAPGFVWAQAATCQDFANCFRDTNNPCDAEDFQLGILGGTVDGIGDLLCFVGDPKCNCYRQVTTENSPQFDEWLGRIQAIVATCDGANDSGRFLSGIAFQAANDVCTPTFAQDVQPVLTAACGTCHITGSSGNFNFAAGLSALVNVPSNQSALPYIAPGNPDNSYLVAKIRGTQASVGGGGVTMPLGGMLPPADILLIEGWVAGGALP